VISFLLVLSLQATPPVAEPLPRPPALEPAVQFWKQVFSAWDENQIVYFDGRDLSRIYGVRRLPPDDGTASRARLREELRRRWKTELIQDFEFLAGDQVDYDALAGRPHRLYHLWDQARDPALYQLAAERLRSQRGIRERFLGGIARSARYVDEFRAIFAEEGVPQDLVHLPHVESSYLWNARSSVGALGMWQFMRRTARSFDLVVDDAVDERLDPHSAARGAARYLRAAYEELGAWPLAVTSYNHGVDGMKNAVRETGTRAIETIIAEYDGPLFGFAGRNFYPELLAARDLADSLLADPGELELHLPVAHDPFTLPAYVKLTTVAKAFGVSRSDLETLNPALSGAARRGDLYLTRGYTLRIPRGLGEEAPGLFAGIPAKHRPVKKPQLTYRVRSGDSLSTIAQKHRTSVRTLQRLNGIRNPNRIRAGMVLKLPH
jgi:membrane-bound lytic murein transglycosylase D